MSDIINLSDDEFRFYDEEYITINNIEFALDIDKLERLLQTPEFNKQRYDKKKDQVTLQLISQLRNQISTKLEEIINNTKGNFSDKGDMIQGLVLKLNNGNAYGMFSQGYKNMKKQYHKYQLLIDDLQKQFLKNIFGYSQTRLIRTKYDNNKEKEYQEIFNKTFSDYVDKFGKLLNQLKNDRTIPKGTKSAQYQLLKTRFEKLYPIKNFNEFKEKMIFKNEKTEEIE